MWRTNQIETSHGKFEKFIKNTL
ncbi:Protein of unknown function [Bacillus mycoides]|nr:Protein of unknown function [Bacillus mycoides]